MEILASLAFGVAFVVILRFLFRQSRTRTAPSYEGLYTGERLIDSCAADLRIDDIGNPLIGFAYLTDMRLVWVPQMSPWRSFPLPTDLDEVNVSFGQVRKVAVKRRLWLTSPSSLASKSLFVRTPTADIGLWLPPKRIFQGRTEYWSNFLAANAPNYGKPFVRRAGLPDSVRADLLRRARVGMLVMLGIFLARSSV
jgi:hypothetical protein